MAEYSGVIYRPPYEARSFLLQVTRGCSHGRCSFCTMYSGIPFAMEPMEEIKEDIKRAAQLDPGITRVFLENGDPFCLSENYLIEIAEALRESFPKLETIAMYASVKNIRDKTDEALRILRSLGVNDLNIGVESGLEDALRLLNKGYSAEEAEYELLRLKAAGIDFGANIILGCAGRGRGLENAETTARLLNAVQPGTVFTGTIHASPGCTLYEAFRSGEFEDSTFGEYIDEEERLLQLLELENSRYYSTHPSNFTGLKGRLSRDRERLLSEIGAVRDRFSAILDRKPAKKGEEGIILGYL